MMITLPVTQQNSADLCVACPVGNHFMKHNYKQYSGNASTMDPQFADISREEDGIHTGNTLIDHRWVIPAPLRHAARRVTAIQVHER